MPKLSKNTKGLLTVLGGFIIQLCCAQFYIWGNLNLYFTSYYRSLDKNLNLSQNLGVVTSSFLDLIASTSMFLAVPISNKITPRLTLRICGYAIALILFGISFIQSPFVFMPSYTLLIGSFNGVLWMTSLNNVLEFFPHKKGLCSGIVLSGVGVGTLIGNQISKISINPLNEEAVEIPGIGKMFSDEVSRNFPFGLRMLAIYFFVVTMIGCLLTFNYRDAVEEAEKEDNDKEKQIEISQDPLVFASSVDCATNNNETLKKNALEENFIKKLDQDTDLSIKPLTERAVATPSSQDPPFSFCEELKHLTLLKLFCVNAFSNAAIIFFAANFKNYGIIYIPDDDFLTLVGSCSGITNGVGRIALGIIGDKIGFVKTLIFFHVALVIFISSMDYIIVIKELYLIWNCVLYLILGGRTSLMPSVTYQIFGNFKGSRLFPFVSLGNVVGNFIQYFLVEIFVSCCGYTYVLYFLSINAFLSLILLLRIK